MTNPRKQFAAATGAALTMLAALVCALALPTAAFAVTNEGGEYTYTGSPNDMRTTGQTGDQIWNVQTPVSVANFFPGQNDTVPYWQIYTGASITGSAKSRLMNGNVVFENEVKWTGSETDANIVGYLGPARLLLRNGGSLAMSNAPLRIGQQYNANTTSYGTLFMEAPSALTVVGNNLIAGNSNPGTLWVDGGTVSVTNGIFKTGSTANKDGYIRINGGKVSLGSGDNDFLNIGSDNNYGSLHVSGGTISTRRTGGVSGETYGRLGMKYNTAADIYVDGGLLDLWNERIVLGDWYTSVANGRVALTVDGDGRVVASVVALGRNGSGNTAVVNLNGGRFELMYSTGFASYGNTGNSRYVNFDGGTLALVKDSRLSFTQGYLGATGEKVVYPKGGAIEVPSGVTAESAVSFRTATGYASRKSRLRIPALAT